MYGPKSHQQRASLATQMPNGFCDARTWRRRTQEERIAREGKKKSLFVKVRSGVPHSNSVNLCAATAGNPSRPPLPIQPSRSLQHLVAWHGQGSGNNECNMVMMHSHSFQSSRKHNMPISSVLITALVQGKVKGEYKQPQL